MPIEREPEKEPIEIPHAPDSQLEIVPPDELSREEQDNLEDERFIIESTLNDKKHPAWRQGLPKYAPDRGTD